MGEDMLATATQRGRLRGVVLRPSIIYGDLHPELPRWSITPGCFCREAVESGTITLRSNGRQFRNYVPMEFVGAAIRRLVELDAALSAYAVFNVAGPETLSIRELAQQAARAAERACGRAVAVRVEETDTRVYPPFQLSGERLAAVTGAVCRPHLEAALAEMAQALQAAHVGRSAQTSP